MRTTLKDAIHQSAMGVDDHRKSSPVSVRCFVITVSDSHDETTDESGGLAKKWLMDAGHLITGYRVIPDEPEIVTSLVREIAEADKADAVLINGGTGLGHRDTTYEALSRLLDQNPTVTAVQVAELLAERGVETALPEVTDTLRQLVTRDVVREIEGQPPRYEYKIELIRLWVTRYKALGRVVEEVG